MYAPCPNCKTVFRVTAQHLRLAEGRVRCGACGKVFNSLRVLVDDLPPPERVPEPPELNDVEADAGAAGHATAAAGRPSQPAEVAEAQAAPESGGTPHDGALDDSVPAPDLKIGSDGASSAPEDAAHPEGSPEDELPLLLRDARRARRPVSRWWAGACAALVLLAVLQVVWFRHAWLADNVPAAAPLLHSLCAALACPGGAPLAADDDQASPVRLLGRDIRYHPGLQSTLLVNATINNEAPEVRPFPVLQLNLFDTNGALIAARRFRPEEYLDGSIDRERGMEPGLPVHIVMEIAGTEQTAVSFEFDFL